MSPANSPFAISGKMTSKAQALARKRYSSREPLSKGLWKLFLGKVCRNFTRLAKKHGQLSGCYLKNACQIKLALIILTFSRKRRETGT